MKKTYIKPETTVYQLAMQKTLLAGSEITLDVMDDAYSEDGMTDLAPEFAENLDVLFSE